MSLKSLEVIGIAAVR